MNVQQTLSAIAAGAYDKSFSTLYGAEYLATARARYTAALHAFAAQYDVAREVVLVSVPGRSEVGGNHTDHNRGRVLCASVNLDCIAVAAERADAVVSVTSEGYGTEEISLSDLEIRETEFYTSRALMRGVASALRARGYTFGGFDAYVTSDVLRGSGLSSSAAYEVMLGKVFSALWCDDCVDAVTLAQVAQTAENKHFGKPSGLMDQIGCAVGGMVGIDFADAANPCVTRVPFDLSAAGYRLCIVNTGGSHADLNDDYASVPAEMKAVARLLGVSVLAETNRDAVLANLPALRAAAGDRAVLRALHFFAENERVMSETSALAAGDIPAFFSLVRESGRSSFQYLQNVYSAQNPREQGLSLALCLANGLLSEERAAWRVHGGGFAGTIQVFLPVEEVPVLRDAMDAAFGAGATIELAVRTIGATVVAPDKQ